MTVSGNLFILSAPSGAGKSSLISALLKQGQENDSRPMQVSVSHTTRDPRPGENNGEHYHFVSVANFKKQIKQNAFYEYAEVFGNYYGTSEAAIDAQLAQGIDVFLDIDWQGAQQVRMKKPAVTSIFISPPSREELESRLQKRNQDSDEVINRRVAQAKEDVTHFVDYDHVIINDDFELALENLRSVFRSQRTLLAKIQQRNPDFFRELLK